MTETELAVADDAAIAVDRTRRPAMTPAELASKGEGKNENEDEGEGEPPRLVTFGGLATATAFICWEALKTRPVFATQQATHGIVAALETSAWMFAALAIASMGALYIFMARCVSKRAALYAVLVLATMPAWFVRARADGSSLALPVLSFACLGLAVLDRDLGLRGRAAAFAFASLSAWLGTRSGGLLIVLGTPAVAIGAVRLLVRDDGGDVGGDANNVERSDADRKTAKVSAGAVLVVGCAVLALTAIAMFTVRDPNSFYVMALLGPRGSAASGAQALGFASLVPKTVYALVPWTPLLPFTIARAQAQGSRRRRRGAKRNDGGFLAGVWGRSPQRERRRGAKQNDGRLVTTTSIHRTHAQVAIVLVAILTLAAETIAYQVGVRAGAGAGAAGTFACGALAAAVGMMLDDLDATPASPKALLAAGVFAIGALVAHDLTLSPDRALEVLAPGLPTGHALGASHAARTTLWVIAGTATIALLVDPSWLRIGSFHPKRGMLILVAGVLGGVVLRAHTYPDLIARISPGRAFDAWSERRKDGDLLGLLGVDEKRWPRARTQATQDNNIVVLDNPENAARWLTEPSGASTPLPAHARRFLAIGPAELSRVNAAFRAKSGQNVRILSGEGAFLLGVSTLMPDEHDENSLNGILMNAPPDHLHPVSARLEALEVLGWEIRDTKGVRQDVMRPARNSSAHLRIALRITGADANATASATSTADPLVDAAQPVQRRPPLTGYCTFIHIDHTPTRFGAEHREHVYPMSLWREGDIVIDDFAVDLPPHFGAGSYAAYWGVGVLPCQDDRRMQILSGNSDGNHRVALGRVEVR